jgi:hypothetical protein
LPHCIQKRQPVDVGGGFRNIIDHKRAHFDGLVAGMPLALLGHERGGRIGGRIAAGQLRKFVQAYLFALGENHGAEHRIFELPHIARPGQAFQ